MQEYIVLQVTTPTGKKFSVVGFLDENIIDIKKRIQDLEGIPTHQQKVLLQGMELYDLNPVRDL